LFSKKQGRKARMEPYVSQIPISIKQLVDQQKKLGELKMQAETGDTVSSSGSSVFTSTGSVHTAGSSLLTSAHPSYLPRPIGDQNTVSGLCRLSLRCKDAKSEETTSRVAVSDVSFKSNESSTIDETTRHN